jgi:predicted PurR-regulated permease PerM
VTATPVDAIASPSPAEPGPQTPRVEVVVSMRTVALGLAILLGIVLVVVVKDALLSIALACVLVLGLDPPVSALERRGWGRGLASVAVLAAIALVVFVIVVWAVKPVWGDIRDFVAKLPSYVDEVRHNEPFKSIDKDTDAFKKLESALASAAKDLPAAAASLLGAASSAVSSVFQLVTLAFLTLFGIIAGSVVGVTAVLVVPRRQRCSR